MRKRKDNDKNNKNEQNKKEQVFKIESIDHNTKTKRAYNNNTLEVSTSVSIDIKGHNFTTKSIEIPNPETKRDIINFPETIRESINEDQTFRNPFESNRDDLRISLPSDVDYKIKKVEKGRFTPLGSPIQQLPNQFEENIKKTSEKLIHKIKCNMLLI